MKLTNPQFAALADTLRRDYPFIGTVDVRHIMGIDPGAETGPIDVRLFDDTDEVATFEIGLTGGVVYYA